MEEFNFWEALGNSFYGASGNSWINVLVWVAISLLFFEFINYISRDKFIKWISQSRRFQPFIAAVMGIIPGCGASLFLVPLYNKRQITFGALAATFISTMGDASFIILVGDPTSYLIITLITTVVAIIVGYGLDVFGASKRITAKSNGIDIKHQQKLQAKHEKTHAKKDVASGFLFFDAKIITSLFWLLIIFAFPASVMVLSVPGLTNEEVAVPDGIQAYYDIASFVAFIAIIIFLSFYIVKSILKRRYHYEHPKKIGKKYSLTSGNATTNYSETAHKEELSDLIRKIASSSIFILVWVFVGTFLYELIIVEGVGEDDFIEVITRPTAQIVLILIGACIGLIPGCGPQIVFANIFISGGVSSAALTANTISQDGDAGFPLLATDRYGYFWIKVVNFIPAIIVGAIMIIPLFNWFTFA